MVIQGTGGGLLKLAIARVGLACREESAHLLLPVHDSVELEVREDDVERMGAVCLSMVDDAIPGISFPVEAHVGRNRGEVVPLDCWLDRGHIFYEGVCEECLTIDGARSDGPRR